MAAQDWFSLLVIGFVQRKPNTAMNDLENDLKKNWTQSWADKKEQTEYLIKFIFKASHSNQNDSSEGSPKYEAHYPHALGFEKGDPSLG